ncbi:MAG TPA: porin [Thermodesulfobacteriota bacterium]|nr:porin [Thermodesulfobacteriota bacterium]
MLKRILSLMIAAIVIACSVPAQAFMLGEESKGVKIQVTDESDLLIRIRMQPRFDYGDIIKNKAGTSYEKDSDMYMRRVRLEMSGQAVKNLKYNLTLDADKWGKAENDDEVSLLYAYLNYTFMPELSVEFGKNKLPYSRVSLSSSSAQLLIERPVSTEAAKKLFGSDNPYYQTAFKVEGKIAGGVFNYALALADGWSNGETVYTAPSKEVFKAGELIVGRMELSPPGWVEAKKSDAHLGKGKHLTLGVNAAVQNNIEYKENAFDEDRKLAGFDLSAHYEGFSAQFEKIGWTVDSSDPAIGKKEPKGWYAQAGYFIAGPDIEPVVRYEAYDQDSNVADKEEKTTTVGLNWYPKGHSLKFGINRAHTKYESAASGHLANDSSKDVYQVQGQFYF